MRRDFNTQVVSNHEMLPPTLGICGFSGAGKTTLIEEIVKKQASLGRRICVLKHDVHQLNVDKEGKDSYRFFSAGADTVLQNRDEFFFRGHNRECLSVEVAVRLLAPYYDGLLVEGHKNAKLPHKVWLLHPKNDSVPQVEHGFECVITRDENCVEKVCDIFESLMESHWQESAVSGAILIGGKSSRFGRAKHLMQTGDATWIEKMVSALHPHMRDIVIVGKGEVPQSLAHLPRLPDVPDAVGPIAGMRAAFRWNPMSSWVVTPCDLPRIKTASIQWLLKQRGMARDAIQPVLSAGAPVEPLLAYYDYRCGPAMEHVNSPRRLAEMVRVHTPVVPDELSDSWHNVNSPNDLA